eukprot:6210742-Pleurochrysis_carterae.AAC.1
MPMHTTSTTHSGQAEIIIRDIDLRAPEVAQSAVRASAALPTTAAASRSARRGRTAAIVAARRSDQDRTLAKT